MATARSFEWIIRRYRLCFFICIVFFAVQIFLATKLLLRGPLENSLEDKYHGSVGKNPIFIEDDGVSSRKFKDGTLSDDEDSNNQHLRKHKVPPDKIIPLGNKNTVESSLNLEELDFTPSCDIHGKEAVSAIHRAPTQHCKKELADIICKSLAGKLYPEKLKSLCPSGGNKEGKPLGCFQDSKQYRLLTGYFALLKHNNSPKNCINLCLQSGYQYAGVQYSSECFCGNDEPAASSRLPDSSCNMPCTEDPHLACGGFFTVNIYQTGIPNITDQLTRSSPVNLNEPRARVAYILTLNGRASRQVKRLIRAIFHSDHFIYIHVDARQDYLFREMLKLEYKFPNHVKVARNREATIWGGASLLTILLKSMNELLQLHKKWPWDFVINLSESDFPLKSNENLVHFLTANKGRNFVKSFGKDVQRFIQKQGLDKTFHECEHHMWRLGDRKLPWGVQIDGGSDWIALSYPFVQYVASGPDDQLLEGLKLVFKHTLLPAESFFHTTLRNSHLCATYIDNNLHVTNWKRKIGCKCQYKHVVDWCGCSPNDFKPSDWPRLLATEERDVYFARKFESVVSQQIIKQLEEWLYGPHVPNLLGLDSYWQSLYHYADITPSPDEALITVAHSLTRTALRNICPGLQFTKLLEIYTYHQEDIHMGCLIKYKVLYNKETFTVESWVKQRSMFHILTGDSILGSRIKSFSVSSDFDVKEHIARNFMGALGPFSQPTAIIEFSLALMNSSAVNASLLWLDPVGWLADITELHIDDSSQILNSKPNLKTPMRPGIWTAKLVLGKVALAQSHFLITPLEFIYGSEIQPLQAEVLHAGPSQPYKITTTSPSLVALISDPYSPSSGALLRKATSNAKRTGKDLRDWIDSLVLRFYSITATCTEEQKNLGKQCPVLDTCARMPWSTFSPDPKSEIGIINEATGRLD